MTKVKDKEIEQFVEDKIKVIFNLGYFQFFVNDMLRKDICGIELKDDIEVPENIIKILDGFESQRILIDVATIEVPLKYFNLL